MSELRRITERFGDQELLSYLDREERAKIGRPLAVGDVIHGFAGGIFGRDHYVCCQVEALGRDWVVTRSARGTVEFLSGAEDIYGAQVARDGQCENESYNCFGEGQ